MNAHKDADEAEDRKIHLANLEREKVIKRIKDLEMDELKSSRADSGNEEQWNTEKIGFDFEGLLSPLKREAEYSKEPEACENIQPVKIKERINNGIYDTDPLFGPMLERTGDISRFDFFVNDTDEELAIMIDDELYINRAATIRFMVMAEYANRNQKGETAKKLWEAVCFYSIDSGYMNMAFWHLVDVVYQSNLNEAKAVIKVMTKKEKKLLRIINELTK